MLEAIITGDASAVIVITAPPKTGTSRLLCEMRTRAMNAALRIAPMANDDAETGSSECAFIFDRSMTSDDFSSRVPSRHDTAAAGTGGTLLSGATASDTSLAERLQEGATFEQLSSDEGRPSPVLVLIDDYRPTEQFEHWFLEEFVADLHNLNPPWFVLIGGFEDALQNVIGCATTTLTLEPLSTHTIEAHLKQLNDRMSINKMSDDEIQHYLQPLREDPALIDALERVLVLDGMMQDNNPRPDAAAEERGDA